MSSNSNSDFKMAIGPASTIECTNTVVTNTVSCIFPIEITSIAESPKSLSGKFFAEVNGKIYLADASYGGIDSISETWNPGESKSGVVPFNVPLNSSISSIFLGPDSSSSVDDAVLSLTVSVIAVDGWNPEIQQRLLQLSNSKDLVSRLTKSSGYAWTSNFDDENNWMAIFINQKSTSDPFCFSLIYPISEMILSEPNFNFYEDLKSGLGISHTGTDRVACGEIFEAIPGVQKVTD
jgi:hypothetical protein